MGKIILIEKQKMKVFVLTLVLAIAVNAQAPVNTLTQCMTDVVGAMDIVLQTATSGLNEDILGTIAKIAEVKQRFTDATTHCPLVNMTDAEMWLDQHTNQAQKDCISKVLAGLLEVQSAETAWNDKTKSAAQKLAAWANVTSKFDDAWNNCTNGLT